VASDSALDINGNTFENIKCEGCNELIISINKCDVKIKSNLFRNNIA